MQQIPEWVATATGMLFLENIALKRALAEAQPPPEPDADPVEPPQ